MKKPQIVFFLLALNLLVFKAFAQLPEPGSFLVGGSVGTINFTTKNKDVRTTTLSGTPQLGVLLTRNLAIGLGVPFFVSHSETQGIRAITAEFKTSQVGISPFLRYYLTQSQFRPYVTASAGQTWFRYTATGSLPGTNEDVKDDFFSYNAGLGVAYFINRNISFDAAVLYNGGDDPSLGITLTNPTLSLPSTVSVQVGFQIFL